MSWLDFVWLVGLASFLGGVSFLVVRISFPFSHRRKMFLLVLKSHVSLKRIIFFPHRFFAASRQNNALKYFNIPFFKRLAAYDSFPDEKNNA